MKKLPFQSTRSSTPLAFVATTALSTRSLSTAAAFCKLLEPSVRNSRVGGFSSFGAGVMQRVKFNSENEPAAHKPNLNLFDFTGTNTFIPTGGVLSISHSRRSRRRIRLRDDSERVARKLREACERHVCEARVEHQTAALADGRDERLVARARGRVCRRAAARAVREAGGEINAATRQPPLVEQIAV